MSKALGKKRYTIDQPNFPVHISISGTGWMNLITGNALPNPILDKPIIIQYATQLNNSPVLNVPSIAWT